jgi:methionyl-tRNA formyltransferase
MRKLLLVGDHLGLSQLLKHVPKSSVVAICAASIRPEDLPNCMSLADLHSLELLIQPRRNSQGYLEFLDRVRELDVDLVLVHSYSMILPEELLNACEGGGLNIHWSLLPRNRGANPIQWAIIKGEKVTGVTLHRMQKTLDSGAIVNQRSAKIRFWDSWITVSQKLLRETEKLIQESLPLILSGDIEGTPQDESKATSNRRRTPIDSKFSWSDQVVGIYRLHRAVLPPHPPAYAVNSNGTITLLTRKLNFLFLAALVCYKRASILNKKIFYRE